MVARQDKPRTTVVRIQKSGKTTVGAWIAVMRNVSGGKNRIGCSFRERLFQHHPQAVRCIDTQQFFALITQQVDIGDLQNRQG